MLPVAPHSRHILPVLILLQTDEELRQADRRDILPNLVEKVLYSPDLLIELLFHTE